MLALGKSTVAEASASLNMIENKILADHEKALYTNQQNVMNIAHQTQLKVDEKLTVLS